VVVGGAKQWLARLAHLVAVELPQEGEQATSGRLLKDCLGRQRGWAVILCTATVSSSLAALILPAIVATAIDAASTRAVLSTPVVNTAVVLAVLTVSGVTAELATSYYIAGTTAGLQDRMIRTGVPGDTRDRERRVVWRPLHHRETGQTAVVQEPPSAVNIPSQGEV
jgi:hypothetical protein